MRVMREWALSGVGCGALRPLLSVLILVCLSACRDVPPPASLVDYQISDGQQDLGWTQDSAGMHLQVSHLPSGGVEVAWTASGADKGILRKEVQLDLSQATALVCSLRCDQPQQIAWALRGEAGGWFQTPVRGLAAGVHRDLHFPITFGEATWSKQRARVQRLNLLIFPGSAASGNLVLEEVAISAPAPIDLAPAVDGALVEAPAGGRAGEPLTWVLRLQEASPRLEPQAEAILPGHLAGRLRLRTSAGEIFELQGWNDPKRDAAALEPGRHYIFSYTPFAAGSYRWQLGHRHGQGWHWQEVQELTILSASSETLQPLRRHPRRADLLIDGSGQTQWPIGQNLAWIDNPEPWLQALAAAGGDLARVWLCPWHLHLFVDDGLQHIDQSQAQRLEALLAAASRHRVRIILVLNYHDMLGSDWPRNPFNQANGGVCRHPQQFWTHAQARKVYRRVLDYLVARYSAAPALAAWELWNEADLCPRFADTDIVDWHREMAAHLRDIDPHRRLVSTSTSSPSKLPELWRLPEIDLIQVHAYRQDLAQVFQELETLPPDKPRLLAELGRDWRVGTDQRDQAGEHLLTALFLSWMRPLAGSSMPWWWDIHLQPAGLEKHFASLAAYIAGEDRAAVSLTPFMLTLPAGAADVDGLQVAGLRGEDRLYALVYRQRDLAGGGELRSLAEEDQQLRLGGLAAGTWQLQWWNCREGMPLIKQQLEAGPQGLVVPLPSERLPLALKLHRQQGGFAIELSPTPALPKPEP